MTERNARATANAGARTTANAGARATANADPLWRWKDGDTRAKAKMKGVDGWRTKQDDEW
jgi:hypothetical protein